VNLSFLERGRTFCRLIKNKNGCSFVKFATC